VDRCPHVWTPQDWFNSHTNSFKDFNDILDR
jgi:hypothetical protein